jgi:hypothetical protein
MKTHKNHLKNQALRRKNPDIRCIVDGKPNTFWPKIKLAKPEVQIVQTPETPPPVVQTPETPIQDVLAAALAGKTQTTDAT